MTIKNGRSVPRSLAPLLALTLISHWVSYSAYQMITMVIIRVGCRWSTFERGIGEEKEERQLVYLKLLVSLLLIPSWRTLPSYRLLNVLLQMFLTKPTGGWPTQLEINSFLSTMLVELCDRLFVCRLVGTFGRRRQRRAPKAGLLQLAPAARVAQAKKETNELCELKQR